MIMRRKEAERGQRNIYRRFIILWMIVDFMTWDTVVIVSRGIEEL
jgi:hypothetical protein